MLKRKNMTIIMRAISILITLSFTLAYASDAETHKDHNHDTCEHDHNSGIKSKSIQKIAEDEVKRLVLEKKIAKSWKLVPVTKIGRNYDAYIDDWIVVFDNPKIKKKARRTLYIFVSKKGNVMGANYTGK